MLKKHIVLLGAPGAGKGSQASLLKNNLAYFHVSTGELLRKEVASGSKLGMRVSEIINNGNLVDDQTVLELLSNNVDLKSQSVIFDGFPRTLNQAHLLSNLVLKDENYFVLFINLPTQEVVNRICLRRSCSSCGEIYNLKYKKPKLDGVCDLCGGSLVQRKDDNEESLKERLNVFNHSNAPILNYYREQNKLCEVDGSASQQEIFTLIKEIIEK